MNDERREYTMLFRLQQQSWMEEFELKQTDTEINGN